MKFIYAFLFIVACIKSAFAAGIDDLDLGNNPYLPIYQKTDSLVIINTYDKLTELEYKYNLSYSRGQSFANRMLGAAAIGAGGIGGMMLVSGLAESAADAAAERDMAAYIATFKCDYGNGKNINGGEKGIILPGANNLLALRTEYISLASDIKTRKESLELPPGIETEVIQNAAASGLYDNANGQITNLVNTSIYRALTAAAGEDSSALAIKRSAITEQIKTGGITLGSGVVGGAVGNLIINAGDNPD